MRDGEVEAYRSTEESFRKVFSVVPKMRAMAVDMLSYEELGALYWSGPDAQRTLLALVRAINDGTLGAAPRVQDRQRMGSDTSFRVVAESALRALRTCAPFKLPYNQYDMWKDIIFTFDPKEALG